MDDGSRLGDDLMVVVKAVYYMSRGGYGAELVQHPFAWRIILGMCFLLLFSCYLE
jgi:hypothetical protein